MGNRPWTPQEETYLMEKWGQASIPAIAKKLERTIGAVKLRASRLRLGPVLMGGDYVTLNQLLVAVTGSRGMVGSSRVFSSLKFHSSTSASSFILISTQFSAISVIIL